MAKQINFPDPLYINNETLEFFKYKFYRDLTINFLSNKNILISTNCLKKNIPYLLGNFNATVINEYPDDKGNFNVFLISELDYGNAKKGIYSDEVLFFIKSINKKQSLVDSAKSKVSANIYIVQESTFYDYYEDRKLFINKHSMFKDIFLEEELFRMMSIQKKLNLADL